jgi:hypothetical protein
MRARPLVPVSVDTRTLALQLARVVLSAYFDEDFKQMESKPRARSVAACYAMLKEILKPGRRIYRRAKRR